MRKRTEVGKYRFVLILIVLVVFASICVTRTAEDDITNDATKEVLSVTSTEPVASVSEALVEEIIPETTEETEFVSYYDYTEEELDLLARLVYSEGGTESYYTKLRLASVVMNRVSDPYYYPDTIREVIYEKGQFAVTFIKINGVVMIDRPADEESYRAAKEVLDYGSVLPSTVEVFYASYCDESWVNSREVYEVSDNTVFAHIYPKGG